MLVTLCFQTKIRPISNPIEIDDHTCQVQKNFSDFFSVHYFSPGSPFFYGWQGSKGGWVEKITKFLFHDKNDETDDIDVENDAEISAQHIEKDDSYRLKEANEVGAKF